MCISLVTPAGAASIDYLGEYVWLEVVEGYLACVEVYDIFFTVHSKVDRMYAVSPHHLLTTGENLSVEIVPNPGTGDGRFDNFYKRLSSNSVEYIPSAVSPTRRARFKISVENPRDEPPGDFTIDGEVVVPRVSLPTPIVGEREAVDLAADIGTVFELKFENLVPGERYAMRVIVRPVTLLIDADPVNLPDPRTDEESPEWEQVAKLNSAFTLYDNVFTLLDTALQFPGGSRGAYVVQQLLYGTHVECCRIERQRIALILPRRAEIASDHREGNIWRVGRSSVSAAGEPSPRTTFQWAGGTDIYWADHPYTTASHIYHYLEQWAKVDPKTKEQITAGLNLRHEHTGLIVDALVQVKAVKDVGAGKYQAIPLTNSEEHEAFSAVMMDPKVKQGFRITGFEIEYTLRYVHVSKSLSRSLWIRKWRDDILLWGAFIIAVAGLIVGFLALR